MRRPALHHTWNAVSTLHDDTKREYFYTYAAVYVIAARRSATAVGRVRFTGLPSTIEHGTVLAHPGGNPARPVTVKSGAFTDPSPYRPHDARVYRFPAST